MYFLSDTSPPRHDGGHGVGFGVRVRVVATNRIILVMAARHRPVKIDSEASSRMLISMYI